MPKLLLKFNAAVLKEIPVSKDVITVGRKPDNDVVIDNPAISGHHCRISLQGGGYYVEDLDSTNGTYVNETEIEPRRDLAARDVIRIGAQRFLFTPLCQEGFHWDDEGLLK